MQDQQLTQQMNFIVQATDTVTIPTNEAPAFEWDSVPPWQQIINFLRCGLQVQILYRPSYDATSRRLNKLDWDKVKIELEELFGRLKLVDEEFEYDYDDESWTVLVDRKT